MAKFEMRHRYSCDEETFWKEVFFDQDFNKKLFYDHLKFTRWEVTSFDETDAEIRRSLEIVPTTGAVPGPLKKFAEDLGFTEKGVFDKSKRHHRFTVTPNRMADKITIEGEVRIEPRGDGIERIINMTVTAKVFGVGGLIEKRIIADTRASYDAGHAYAQKTLGY